MRTAAQGIAFQTDVRNCSKEVSGRVRMKRRFATKGR